MTHEQRIAKVLYDAIADEVAAEAAEPVGRWENLPDEMQAAIGQALANTIRSLAPLPRHFTGSGWADK